MVSISRIEIHAGDFKKGGNNFFASDGRLLLGIPGKFFRQWFPITEIAELEVASEEGAKRLGGTVGWGLAGAALLGPVGLLAGLLVGGKAKDVTFICQLKDGRKFLGTTDSKAYTKMSAALFR
jgi:hypothetical protein